MLVDKTVLQERGGGRERETDTWIHFEVEKKQKKTKATKSLLLVLRYLNVD